MPVRVRVGTAVSISSTSAEERDLGNKNYEVLSDSLGEGGTWKTKILAATSDVEVSLRDVADASLLAISTNAVNSNQTAGSITLKRNTVGNEEIEIVPLAGTARGLFLITTTGLTAIFVSNAGTVDMEITLTVAGD